MTERLQYSQRGDHIDSLRPVTVSRYRPLMRLNHWVTAASMVILVISGLALFTPGLYWLSALFGSGQVMRLLHPVAGCLLFVSFLLMFVQLWRLNLPRREDADWVAGIGDVLKGNEENLPELGKYNAGQKFIFWGMAVMILVMFASGIMIWQQFFPDLVVIETRRWALLLHSLGAVGVILLFILHVYAAIWTRGTIRAMTRGSVTGGWAYKHHRKWLKEIARRDTSKPAE